MIPDFDGRRRRYVPIDVTVAFGPFGLKLAAKWGMEGLCAWMLLLAAAKREPNQGTFTYTSEPEAWTKLGATAVAFDFDTFITFCGRNKQTRKTRSGQVTYVEITGWERWNKEWDRAQDNQRKPRTSAQNTPDDTPEVPREYDDVLRAEYETDTEPDPEYEAEAGSAAFKIPDPFARLLAVLPDKTALTVERLESMHRKHRFSEGDFVEAIEAASSDSVRSPSAVAIQVLKKRVSLRPAA